MNLAVANGGVPQAATDEPGRKAALLRVRIADAPAFAADPALAWSAPPWRRGRGRRIAEYAAVAGGAKAQGVFYSLAREKDFVCLFPSPKLRAPTERRRPHFSS
jgi:hypothetical protein